MGNKLCKERMERASDSKNPVDRILGRCAQILLEFELFHPEKGNNLITIWDDNFEKKIIASAHAAKEHFNEPNKKIHQSSYAVYCLLSLVPPTTKGRGARDKCNIVKAFDKLIVFHEICPSSLGGSGSKNNWNKHVLETRPHETQPQRSDGWKTATLSVPSVETKPISPTEIKPVAPPRKKRRSSSFAAINHSMPNGGFKDVFGPEDRRYSHESIFNPDKKISDYPDGSVAQYKFIKVRTRSLSSSNDDFADFSKEIPSPSDFTNKHRVPKVGNKKTDKFFGENLSDCLSDEKVNEQNERSEKKLEENNSTLNEESVKKSTDTKLVRSPPPDPPKRKTSQPTKVIVEKETVPKNVTEATIEKTSSLDRKAEFLMAMLNVESSESDKQSDEDYYKGKEPIEEPLMVSKSRNKRCICCDDDDALRLKLHRHEQCVEETNKAIESPSVEAPRKPSRDFAIYRKSLDLEDEIIPHEITAAEIQPKVEPPQRNRARRTISREDLPKPPPRPVDPPKINSEKKSRPKPPPIPIKQHPHVTHLDQEESKKNVNQISEQSIQLHRNISMPAVADMTPDDNIDSFLKKCKSSNSFLTEEVMGEILHKAYHGFSGIEADYWTDVDPNDSYDGSQLCSPKSTLGIKKISVSRLSSNSLERTPEINNDIDNDKLTFSIGVKKIECSKSDKENEKIIPKNENQSENILVNNNNNNNKIKNVEQQKITENIINKKIEKPEKIIKEIKSPEVKLIEPNPLHGFDEQTLKNILESNELNTEAFTSVLDDIYKTNKNILDDFQNYLEGNVKDAETNKQISNIKFPTSVKSKSSSEVDNQSIAETSSLADFDIDKEKLELTDIEDSESEIEEITETQSKSTPIKNKFLSKSNLSNQRRESIEDMEVWFSHHLDNPIHSKALQDVIHGTRESRRGSEGMISYDTKKIFPFGKVIKQQRGRTTSESSDFFENRNLLVPKTPDQTDSNSNDHSSLLKFIQRESPRKENAN